nr:MAG TPA: helix-turn-helix protein [Caudoviricetes sp.]
MRLIDELAGEFPTLDLAALRILLQIYETPGYSIKDLAEMLRMDHKTAQLKIALMCKGRKGRRSAAYGLIDDGRNLADRRKRSLSVTPRGAELAEKLMSLTRG